MGRAILAKEISISGGEAPRSLQSEEKGCRQRSSGRCSPRLMKEPAVRRLNAIKARGSHPKTG